jgi:predicted ATP-binding protein involved in virulence
MYIDKIELENFRGFKKLTLTLPKDLAVFIGINGSGKSSILDAIAILLSQLTKQWTNSTQRSSKNTLELTEDDINVDDNLAAKITIFIKSELFPEAWDWSVSIDRRSKKSKVIGVPGSGIKYHLKKMNTSLPAIIYYQVNRIISGTNSKTSSQKSSEQNSVNKNAYSSFFANKMYDFKDFFLWFEEEENYENEIRLRQNSSYKNPSLEVIRLVISMFLNTSFNANFTNLRVSRANTDRQLGFYKIIQPYLSIEKDSKELKLEQLSDGEKTLLIIICDIARRLAMLNNQVEDPQQIRQGKGIVLIDEIDLHLHPKWQRQVIPSLIKTFPNCQFIVTTHSPQVLSKINKENIFILEDYQVVEKTPHSYGRDSNSILYELMGVEERPVDIQRKIDKCFQLIDNKKIDEAKLCLNDLSNLLGEDDVEIVRANTLIEFLENVA